VLYKTLQEFLAGYLKKNKRDQVESPAHHIADEDVMDDDAIEPRTAPTDYIAEAIDESDIPFMWLLPLILPALGLLSSGVVA